MDDFGFDFTKGYNPRTGQEDCVDYYIHLPNSKDAELADLLPEIEAVVKPYTDQFIWQRDSFQLSVGEKSGITYLHGQTEFGESIDDEWFIVFLLREISKKFPQLWIRVADTDGEFLLIEAAHVIPKWLSPETADNRVWINKGGLHIIPRSKEARSAAKAGILQPLELKDALRFIEEQPKELQHIRIVEEEAFFRIVDYPAALENHFHNARVTVPRTVAKVLHERPQLIPSIVETFCNRDPVQMKISNTMPTFPPRDPVNMSVKFTKISYAQLFHETIVPPRPFILPPEKSPLYPASERGMKLTIGLELLVSSKGKKGRISNISQEIKGGLNGSLPTDEEIKTWNHKEDSEDWMDIDYDQFEANLSGKKDSQGLFSGNAFEDKSQQDKLKKMMENFEKFMNDDTAGFRGAAFDSDDDDDISDDEGDISTEDDEEEEGEDKDASFDEKEFANMMREMMGLPPEVDEGSGHVEGEVSGDDDGSSIRQTMAKMEQELVEAGALDPNRPGADASFIYDMKGKKKAEQKVTGYPEELDPEVRYEVAKNMLESLKSQGASAGPAANLLSSMGFTMPRNEDEKP